jgi:hypothetical protein
MKEKAAKKQFLPDLSWPQATLIVFLGVAGFFLWAEYKAHLLGVLPYLVFLLCPLMHIFMHKDHGHHDDHKRDLNHRTDK